MSAASALLCFYMCDHVEDPPRVLSQVLHMRGVGDDFSNEINLYDSR